jgi:DNA polymerase-1
LKGLPALDSLIKWCKGEAKEHGYIIGLDGRQVKTRYQHAALNTLLQSAGAIICKIWLVKVMKMALKAGYKHGYNNDFVLCAWVHDEIQVACRSNEVASDFKRFSIAAMTEVENELKSKCRLDVGSQVGLSWKDTH